MAKFEPRPITWVREGSCLRCTSHKGIEGYPYLTRNYVHQSMARWILWRRYKGAIPPGIVARHTCDNAWCINPRHIISGTIADNNRDKMERRRSCHGEKRANAKLTEEAVRSIRSRPHETDKTLAREFGVTTSNLWRVRHRISWKHVE